MLTRQLFRIFLFFAVITAFAALSSIPSRAAPYAAFVMDARTGETLYAKNADTRLHPASLTKMLTLYITFDAIERGEISLDTMVTVSQNAASQPPSRLGLRAGQRIALRYLIRAAAVKSANDAAAAIGDALSGSEAKFAARMNRTAKALGMKSSTFKNANGLTAAGHLSTARDMSVLGRRLFYDFPQYYNIFSRRTADAGMAEVANTNRRFLDSYKGADGIKTGYTVAAGFNLTASAERGSKRIIATVFGGTSTAQRNAKMAELMDIGFGEAPVNARVRKPGPANLPDEVPGADLVAEAVAAEAATGGSAKTIRLVTLMKTSPRPRARPGAAPAEALVVALAEADLPGDASDEAPDDADAAAAVVGALQDTIDDAVAAATAPEEPPPFAIASVEDAAALGLAPPPAAAAPAEPVTGPATGVAATEPQPAAPAGDLPFAVVDAEGLPVAPRVAEADMGLPFALISPGETVADAALPDETTIVALSAPMPSRPELAPEMAPQMAPDARAEPAIQPVAVPMPVMRPLPVAVAAAEPEVVTRLSTSGGRNWGVSLGQLPSRGAAERILTKTVLTEGRALGDGLRKVVARGGGYDATVLGLTEDQADLACRRLTARAMDCAVIGP